MYTDSHFLQKVNSKCHADNTNQEIQHRFIIRIFYHHWESLLLALLIHVPHVDYLVLELLHGPDLAAFSFAFHKYGRFTDKRTALWVQRKTLICVNQRNELSKVYGAKWMNPGHNFQWLISSQIVSWQIRRKWRFEESVVPFCLAWGWPRVSAGWRETPSVCPSPAPGSSLLAPENWPSPLPLSNLTDSVWTTSPCKIQ